MKNRRMGKPLAKKNGRTAFKTQISPTSEFLRNNSMRTTYQGRMWKQVIQIKNFHCLICKRLLLFPILAPC